jgi:hypothetical protein
MRINEFYPVIAALLLETVITITLFLVNPEYHTDDFIGFGVISGWLAIFALVAKLLPSYRTVLLVIASLPLGGAAILSLLLSFPIYVPSFLLMVWATVLSSNKEHESTRM